MKRALQLAQYGLGRVSPNPMVGCVLVGQGRAIGEGWHRHYGEAHAEVNAVADAIKRGNESLLEGATAYVTLEPCSHFGKTPPCADLLIQHKIARVVVANPDPNPLVGGRGIARLRAAGIEVSCGVEAEAGALLNKRFLGAMRLHRPYVILKWAESADGYIGGAHGNPVAISGPSSNMLVHQWRTQEDAILVGYRTAVLDNPRLNARHWPGLNPVRIFIDRKLTLPPGSNLLDRSQPTIIVNTELGSPVPLEPERYGNSETLAYLQCTSLQDIAGMLEGLYARKIYSVLVEGGTATLQSFMEAGLWDEIRRCQSPLMLKEGVAAPKPIGRLFHSEKMDQDLWTYYCPLDTP